MKKGKRYKMLVKLYDMLEIFFITRKEFDYFNEEIEEIEKMKHKHCMVGTLGRCIICGKK